MSGGDTGQPAGAAANQINDLETKKGRDPAPSAPPPAKSTEPGVRFTIRLARLTDLDAGIAMYRDFVSQGALAAFPFDDEDGLRAVMRQSVEKGRCIVGEMTDGSLGGVFAVKVARFPHSTRDYLSDLWYFVRPEVRATGLARRLLEAARDYAAKCGLPALFEPMAGTDPAKVDRFYSILGFDRIGGVYLWMPPE